MRHIAPALALLLAAPVQAGVVYNWEGGAAVVYNWEDDAAGDVQPISGRIEFSNEAWRAGEVNYQYRYPDGVEERCGWSGGFCDHEAWADPTSPVISFVFSAPHRPGIFLYYWEGRIGQEDHAGSAYSFKLGETLDGSLYAGGGGNSLVMGENLWDDSPTGWYHENPDENPPMKIVAGKWVLDRSTIPVPLPSTLALMGLGLLLTGSVRRQRTEPPLPS